MTNEQAIRRLEDLQRLYLGNEKFTADIEAIGIAIEALKKSEWIPCSERLPEDDDTCYHVTALMPLMRDRECRVMVSNVPEHAEGYIVARVSDGSLWYWGCWDDEKEAEECASTIGGIVVKGW